MNLVDELQQSAENDDVLIVLRKAKRLASKLGVVDIDEWLRSEQEGYKSQQVPPYRDITFTIVGQTNGYIPAGYGQIMNGCIDLTGFGSYNIPMQDPMSDILNMIQEGGKNQKIVARPMSSDLSNIVRQSFNPEFASQMTFLLKANLVQLRAIPDSVKDKVLDWALALERRGIRGEGLTFNEKERSSAHRITFNIRDCKIEQLNNMGHNLRGTDG